VEAVRQTRVRIQVPRSLHLAFFFPPIDWELKTGLTTFSFHSRRYYHPFTRAYAVSLLFADEIMTNSSWTSGHITSLLKLGRGTWAAYLLNLDDSGRSKANKTQDEGDRNDRVVFPPCDTSEFLHSPLEDRHQSHTLISLAQFRPEKDQAKQLRALAILFERYPQWRDVQVDLKEKKGAKGQTGTEKAGSGSSKGVKLVLMGSCRDEADERRIDGLRRLAKDLGIEVSPEYRVAILSMQTSDCQSKLLCSAGQRPVHHQRPLPYARLPPRHGVHRVEHDERRTFRDRRGRVYGERVDPARAPECGTVVGYRRTAQGTGYR
jgi:glycosyltransferase involved in cell wall biosynthesis